MVRPIFNFFVTQDDGTIIGSAVHPESRERLAYVISPDGNVAERQEDIWHDLAHDDAVYVRFVASQSLHYAPRYLTHRKLY